MSAGCWRFGDVLFDERELELRVDGVLSEVPRKSLLMLLELLRHAGQVVTKQELAQACWPRRIVTDNVLTTTLGRLRQALGEKDRGAIQTVMGYGYRLTAPVSFEGPAPAPLQRLSLKPGDHPRDRPDWTLVENLGGGSADVWLARPLAVRGALAEPRVFKFAIDPRAIAALKREVAISRLLHNVADAAHSMVPVLDSCMDTVPAFIATPFLPGGNLDLWMARRGGPGAIALEQRLELAAQCADVLHVAHAAGVLHLDLKPSNILIDDAERPRVRLCDFGTGTVLNRERLHQYALTQFDRQSGSSASASGTMLYMAPELMAGASPTERSDLYSLGILLYQLVVGDFRRPLSADWEAEVGDELLREDISLCAAGDPRRRLGDAGELGTRLRTLDARRERRRQEHSARQTALPVLRVAYDASRVSSRRLRHDTERAILAEQGACIRVYELQGKLAFAATDALARTLLENTGRTRFAVLDLSRVTEVDPASTRRLADLARDLARADVLLYITSSTATGERSTFGLSLARDAPDLDLDSLMRFADTDHALECCEDLLLAAQASATAADAEVPLAQQYLCEGLAAAEIECLEALCHLREFAAGESLFRVDDPGQSLFLILQGSIDILLPGDDGRERRLSGYGAGMPLGEIALVTGGRRTAEARAVTAVRCYELYFQDLDHVLQAKLLVRLNGMLAQRLATDTSNRRVLGDG